MRGDSLVVLLVSIFTLLCASILCNAASARQSSALSSDDDTEQEEDVTERDDLAQGLPKRKGTRGGSQNKALLPPSFTTACECGKKLEETRIVGGVPTTRDEYPWQAALLSRPLSGSLHETFICGGTLINNLYILAAAHCVYPPLSDPADLIVRLRDYNLNKPDQHKEITKNITEIIPHIKFDPFTGENSFAYDIALLKLDSELTLSQLARVRPICLPSTNTELYESEKAIATGWGGTTPFGENTPSILREVKLRVITNSRCRNSIMFIDPSTIKNNMMCAGNQEKNICYQDDGGPLVILNSDDHYEQIGVSSFSFLCGLYDQPAVFTRVNKFLPWIARNTEGATYCSGFSFPE